jgi:hypothetical protein
LPDHKEGVDPKSHPLFGLVPFLGSLIVIQRAVIGVRERVMSEAMKLSQQVVTLKVPVEPKPSTSFLVDEPWGVPFLCVFGTPQSL